MICARRFKYISSNIRLGSKRLTSNKIDDDETANLRNIGILAHIDAGKTTTTERMLYYSGTIKSMGEVHHGNTVTDFMEQERQRGITITAAAVSFDWNEYQFNLIDTPGHIDFTMEVEQSLGVIDGAIVVLDASAGVEAQTLTVWRQCDEHNLPRIVFVNKMDRQDADLKMCLQSLQLKLDVQPLCLQLPDKNNDKLIGVVDIINLESVKWTGGRGKTYTRRKISESTDGALWERAMAARRELTDSLSAHDDKLADLIIQSDTMDDIEPWALIESVRNATMSRNAYPVLCGSAYKNIGVQTLMDGVIDYLPSPRERNQLYSCFGDELCAKAFKVQHDDRKGVLTYFRIFSGNLSKGQKIFNIPKDKSEPGSLLYVPYADEYKTVAKVTHGNVAVVSGLKATMNGDLITSSQTAANNAKKRLIKQLSDPTSKTNLCIPHYLSNKLIGSEDERLNPEAEASTILGMGAMIPDPVFLCSIEPPSLAFQTPLEVALAELEREDPSLRVIFNEETGQTVLAGMGELHLDIIKERILREYKIDAELGPLQIAYKETLRATAKETYVSDHRIGNVKHLVNVTLSAYPASNLSPKDILKFDHTQESASNLANIYPKQLQAVKQGVESALLHGPKLGCPVIDVAVKLHWLEIGRGTSETFVSSAVSHCLKKIFKNGDPALLEPVMQLEVICQGDYLSRIMSDLNHRRAVIQQVTLRGNHKVVDSLAPLSELLGYATFLRTLSSGTALFSMEFHSYRLMKLVEEEDVIREMKGY